VSAAAAPTQRRRDGRLRRFYQARCFYRLMRLLQGTPLFYPFHHLSISGDFRHLEVAPDSDLVVEGAQRSATSFTFHAFAAANDTAGRPPLKVARHLHAAAQYRRAARWQVPALLLLRDPADCARSTALFHRRTSPRQVLKMWIAFHRSAWRWRRHLLVVPFAVATRSPGLVIAAANRRFGRDFAPWPASPLAGALVMKRLEEANNKRDGGNALTSYVPNAVKEEAKQGVDLAGCERLLARARALHRRWLKESEASFGAAEGLDRPAAST
jgi:hypothetical protein